MKNRNKSYFSDYMNIITIFKEKIEIGRISTVIYKNDLQIR